MTARRLRRLATSELRVDEVTAIRAIMVAAFGTDEEEAFTEDDWQHALGGVHVVLDVDGEIVAHASVLERALHVGDVRLRTGYVEAVAVAPERQGVGLGSLVMADATAIIRETYALGALGTGRHAFYERLGWTTWLGPLAVRGPDGTVRTPDEEGYVLILTTTTTPPLDPAATISCDWRPGDVW